MKLSTSTNLFFLRPNGGFAPMETSIDKISAAGFQWLDINYYDWVITAGSPFLADGWEAWADAMARRAADAGAPFAQSHAHIYDFWSPALSEEQRAFDQKYVVRSILAAHRMNIPVVVVHPCTYYGTEDVVKESRRRNREYYLRLLEETSHTNVVLALENMTEADTTPQRKYCATAEELADLIDAIGDARVGACWDFEHGDLMRQNQPRVVRYLGRRLKATHVSDNHGFNPVELTHRLPLFGDTDWRPIMRALRETGYEGCFSFEAHNYLNTLPDRAVNAALALAYQVGAWLMELE